MVALEHFGSEFDDIHCESLMEVSVHLSRLQQSMKGASTNESPADAPTPAPSAVRHVCTYELSSIQYSVDDAGHKRSAIERAHVFGHRNGAVHQRIFLVQIICVGRNRLSVRIGSVGWDQAMAYIRLLCLCSSSGHPPRGRTATSKRWNE